eukprot:CAMPEP_0178382734 /NCGR_PEP_ID=MMETSP0689_2-20121128/6642_1 /TAXON_ID=160604 /ORGANISM="Amphidinium massartii, Strain CS-259" /LENGTH=154 /DNA_ID=CAMNT_0020002939 /DNA_START=393 /DNA_END=857 /DNA_ORIENTATION=+
MRRRNRETCSRPRAVGGHGAAAPEGLLASFTQVCEMDLSIMPSCAEQLGVLQAVRTAMNYAKMHTPLQNRLRCAEVIQHNTAFLVNRSSLTSVSREPDVMDGLRVATQLSSHAALWHFPEKQVVTFAGATREKMTLRGRDGTMVDTSRVPSQSL